MKLEKVQIVTIVVAFSIGVALGTLSEKAHNVRSILKFINVSHWTRTWKQPTAISEAGIPEKHQGKLKLFILAGQSNMSGMGDILKLETDSNPRIYLFGNDYRWKLAREPVDDPIGQVDTVSKDKSAGFSPALSFATTLAEQHPDMAIGLIPCAKGGSLIHDWRKNLDDNTLYGSCLKRARAASLMGNVAGLLYFQGEIDAVDPKEQPRRTFLPNQWADRFTVFVKDWRSDLNLPELPIIFAQIGTNTNPERFKNWAVVKEQQRTVRLPFSKMIVTDDLALKDYVHFTTESYQIIGQRFAKAYLNVLLEVNRNRQRTEKTR